MTSKAQEALTVTLDQALIEEPSCLLRQSSGKLVKEGMVVLDADEFIVLAAEEI